MRPPVNLRNQHPGVDVGAQRAPPTWRGRTVCHKKAYLQSNLRAVTVAEKLCQMVYNHVNKGGGSRGQEF